MLRILHSPRLVGKIIPNWKISSEWTVANIFVFYGSFYVEQCAYLLKHDFNINLNKHQIIFNFKVMGGFFLNYPYLPTSKRTIKKSRHLFSL